MPSYVSRPVEVEAMRWQTPYIGGNATAESIVRWVNANGGEARYEPATGHSPQVYGVEEHPARIAVRTVNGWAYAAPGHYIVMGDAMFDVAPRTTLPHVPMYCRDFYPCDPETFEKHWTLKEQNT